MKSLTPNSPEKNKKEKEMSSMLESIENKHGKLLNYRASLPFLNYLLVSLGIHLMGKLLMF